MTRQLALFVAGVDLGKSACRVGIATPDGAVVAMAEGAGAPGLADPNGAEVGATVAADRIDAAMTKVIRGDADVARIGARITTIVVGAAGAESAVEAAPAMARLLAKRCAASHVAITTDAVTSHAGALQGEPGVVLAAGTGVVAWGLAADGRAHRADGWGQWVGDDGSGAWIGREALRMVVRAVDGRGPATALTDAAAESFGSVARIPAALPFGPALPRDTAAFVPAVVRCATAGDAVALDVLRRAAAHWGESTVAAARAVGEHRVTYLGGLTTIDLLRTQWERALPDDLTIVSACGTSVDGAVLLAVRPDLPHEPHVRRYDHSEAT